MKQLAAFLQAVIVIGTVEALVMLIPPLFGLPEGIAKNLLRVGLLFAIFTPLLYSYSKNADNSIEDLRRVEKRFENLFELTPLGSLVTDQQGKILAVNEQIEKLFGYNREELHGEPVEVLIPERFRRKHAGHRANYFIHPHARPMGAVVDLCGLRKDGSEFPIDIALNLFEFMGAPQVICSIRDITERKQFENALREAESHLRDFLDNASDLIQSVSPEGRFRYVNRAWRKSLGYSEEEIPQLSILDIIHPDQRQHCMALFQRAWHGEPLDRVEMVLVAKDGRTLHVSGNVNCRFEHGKPVATRSILRDMTNQRKAQKELDDNNRLLTRVVWELERRNAEANLLNEMADLLIAPVSSEEAHRIIAQYGERLFPGEAGALFVYRSSKNVLEAVAAWGELWAKEKWFGPDQCWALRCGKLHSVKDSSAGLLCAHVGPAVPGGYVCYPMMAQGETLGVFHLEMAPVHSPETEASEGGLTEVKQRLALSFVDHISLALANLDLRETLRNQSIRDPLTGLYNRRYMDESLQQEMFRASRKKRSVGAILIDLDHFKRTNDMFGHEAGDTLLREVGKLLQQQSRKEDIVCRYGGEEFLFILPETTLDVLQKRAEHLRTAVKALHVSHHGQPLNTLTMSGGVAAFPDHGRTAESLLQAADAALYRAKQEGRDRVVVADAASAEELPATPSIGPTDSRIVS